MSTRPSCWVSWFQDYRVRYPYCWYNQPAITIDIKSGFCASSSSGCFLFSNLRRFMAAELMIGTFAAVEAWIAPDTFEISYYK
jgi:hypothetical protein